MIFELFDGTSAAAREAAWAQAQNVRPAIQVTNLDAVTAAARDRGVPVAGAVEAVDGGRRTELVATEGIRWTLCEVKNSPGHDLAIPDIAHVEVRAHDLGAQVAFYTALLGMHVERTGSGRVVLGQGPGKPWLVLEPGGTP